MDTQPVTREQATRLRDAIRPKLGYLNRLRERMEKVGFVATDPLYQRVKAAAEAMHALFIEAHYLSCASGTGRAGSPEVTGQRNDGTAPVDAAGPGD